MTFISYARNFEDVLLNQGFKHIENTNLEQPIILVDAVFFQLNQSGIARVWISLLEQWAINGFSKHIVVLDRAGTAPKIPGIRYRTVPAYNYSNLDADRAILQEICDEEDADVFISSYYTTPITTPSVFMAHDMIPELLGWNLENPMWQAKHYGIKHAVAYIAVSKNTAKDLVKCFSDIFLDFVVIAKNGVNHQIFSPVSEVSINLFKVKYGINKPYLLLVGADSPNKNIALFFRAFAQLVNSNGFDIILTGSNNTLTPELRTYTSGSVVHTLQLSDEELATAYSGAVALVYPSIYEGFGMPLVEAMACGCPVITCPNSSIPEVAGEAAIYVNHDDVNGLANALCEVQKPNIRQSLIAAGLAQAKNFSWSKMANTVSAVLVDASILYLNLNEINLIVFPDWSQSEELISLDLEKVIKTLVECSNGQKTTLIIDTHDINSEDAAILLSGVTMNLLMQEDLDINEGLKISLLGSFSDIQWTALLPRLTARIILEYENEQAVVTLQQKIKNEIKSNILIEEVKIDDFIHYHLDNNLTELVEKYQQDQNSQSDLEKLRLLRKQVTELLLSEEKNQIYRLYQTKYGEAYKILLHSGIKHESLTESEQGFITEVLAKVAKGFDESNAIQYLLVAMLYCRPHQLPLIYDLTQIPNWLLYDYLEFTLKSPLYFQEIGEVDNYYQYMERCISYLHTNIINNPQSEFWQNIAEYFTQLANFIPLYFNKENLKDIYTKRANIIEIHLQKSFNSIDYDFAERSPERKKIKLGILANHFLPQTETFAALSVYKYLNRDLFEVILFTFNANNHRLERHCFGHADTIIKLPADLVTQVQTIREVDLDILFIATNITAVTHQITLLSLHRLARIQMVDANSPVTTGMRHIDYYISSQLSETEENAQRHYTEKLITLDCPPQCFDFATEEQILATKNICRESLGINENTIVYVSGANYYKIIPEQEVTWAKIIANVPNSVLLLYPFNPNWSSSYPCTAFRKRIVNTFAKHGLSEDRLLILEPAPNRADVKERLKISDIYLDSYPYSGMTSLIDPLEVALPTVVMETETSRSRKGASLLQELGIYDLITNNEEDYIKLAIALGNNPELRQQKSAQIKEKMQGNPIFLNSRSYSAKIGSLFQEISSNYITDTLNQNFRLGDINLIIFPDWSQSEESVISELEQVIKTIATYPNSKKITLIININNFTLEYVELLLSSVTINLLMQEDLDITEGLDFFLVENLNYIQWQTILPHIYARIILDHEDKQTLTQVPVNKLLSCQLDNLNNQLYTISKQGNQMRDKIFKNLITYNIKQIPISLPCDHPLPYYQSRFRLYDKFISVVAKYLPNSQDFIIDIGANIGDTTALMLQYCSNPILCVEADKEFFSIMEHNLSKYRHRTVLVNSFVSGNDYKNVELVKSKGTVRAIESENNIVKSDSLKSIINNNNLDRCIFLKTDTDGFDFEILLSSIDVIKEHSPILYWENEISSLKDTEIAKNLLEQLSTINYEKYIVMDNFGNPLFYGGSSFNVEQINQYLLNNIYTQNNTFYYTDIVAFPSKYSYLISHIMSEYNHFIKNYEVYP